MVGKKLPQLSILHDDTNKPGYPFLVDIVDCCWVVLELNLENRLRTFFEGLH